MGLGLAAVVLGATCRAQDATATSAALWQAPSGVQAYWTVGPALSRAAIDDPTRALLESALRGLTLYTFDGPGHKHPGLRTLLSSGILADQPYRAILLKVHAQETTDSDPRAPLPPLDQLVAVIDLPGCPNHARIIGLVSDPFAGDPETTEMVSLGEVHRVRPRVDGDITEVSWLSTAQGLIVGFGKDAILSYLKERDGPPDPSVAAYQQAIDRSHAAGERVFETFANLDALRRDVPDEMGWGRCARLIDAWGLANARGVMLTARLAPPAKGKPAGASMLRLDFAADDRSEPFGHIRAESLGGTGETPVDTNAGLALNLRINTSDLLRRALRTFDALAPSTPAEAQRRRNWLRTHEEDLRRLASKLGPDILIQPSVQTHGLNLTVSVRSVAGLTADLRAVLDSLAPTVTFDSATQTWRLRLLPDEQDPDHAVQSFTFGLTPAGLVGAWDPAPVRDAVKPREPGAGPKPRQP